MKYKRPTSSFFPRVGGKSRLATRIVRMIPNHDTYVEPFIGGGSVFFKKEPARVEVINDKDKRIYYLYKDMQTVGHRVHEMNFRCSRKIFEEARTSKSKEPFLRLHQNLIVTKQSFGATTTVYMGPKSCKLGKGKSTNIKKSGWRYKERLKEVIIRNQDWQKVTRKYDTPHTFFYFDPPYMTVKGKWGYKSMNPVEIAKVLKKLKGKWLLSYENTPKMRKLFTARKYKITTIPHTYELSGQRQKVSEILIRNY